jgi:pilus assembly protein CpaB
LLIVILALMSGISAAFGVQYFLDNPPSGGDETVPVVVAAAEIPRGTTLTDDLVKTRFFPKGMVPSGSMTRAEDIVGRVASTVLVKDETILDGKLAPRGAGRGMAALTQKGMRAVTILTPNVASGVAGFILPGDRVDVLLTVKGQGFNDPTGGGITTRLLQNVEVVAVDQRLAAPSENKVDPNQLRSVTLLVPAKQDTMLALAQTMGTLHLALRNAEDGADANTQPVTLKDLQILQEKPPEKPKEKAAPPRPKRRPPIRIRIIRGTQESVVTIPQREDLEPAEKKEPAPGQR